MSFSLYKDGLYVDGVLIRPEKFRLHDGKLWIECCFCDRWIRHNKPFIGSLHVCQKEPV